MRKAVKKTRIILTFALVPVAFSILAGCKNRKEAINREVGYYKRHPMEVLHDRIEKCLSNMHGYRKSVKCEGAFEAKKQLVASGQYKEEH